MNNFEYIPMIEQPYEINTDLYPHQLASVYAMEKLESEQLIKTHNSHVETKLGINADPTGYGKTLSMVALVARDKMQWDIKDDFVIEIINSSVYNHIKEISFDRYVKIPTTLILVGSSVCHQWMNEFSNTCLSVAQVSTKHDIESIDVYNYDVVIVTTTFFNKLVSRYYNKAWKRFIFDEPSSLRVPGMREICAGFTWFVTATPEYIYHNHNKCNTSYIKKLTKNYNFKYYMKLITIKNDEDFVKQSFEMPPTHHNYHECYSPIFEVVNDLVSTRIKQMLDAGNIAGAIQSLGGQKTDNIIELVKHKKNLELEEIQSKKRIWIIRGDSEKIQEWEQKEKEVLKQLDILSERFKDILKNNCVICQSQLLKPVMEPICQNIFCGNCLLTWLQKKNSCPICRCLVKKTDLVYINNGEIQKDDKKILEKNCTKEEIIVDLISKKEKSRFIIFSDWNETFNIIRNVLRANKINFLEVKGSAQQREKSVKKYTEGSIPVLFLNSKSNGSGINLQETTDIILYHKMDINIITQIIGRANRIGRKIPLQVHHLISKNTN